MWISATSGYSGGSKSTAEYETVSTGMTGHAESVQVILDPSKLTYGELLQVFFSVAPIRRSSTSRVRTKAPSTAPLSSTRTMSRSASWTPISRSWAEAKIYKHKIVTQVVPLKAFYPAEGYHQNYAARHPDNPYIAHFDLPKIANLQQMFPQLYRKQVISGADRHLVHD